MVVVIMSDNSAKSQWVNYGAGMAAALERPIVVIGRKGSGKSALLAPLEMFSPLKLKRRAEAELTILLAAPRRSTRAYEL